MFYGSPITHHGHDSLQLQAVEIIDRRLIVRLRDAQFTTGPYATKVAAAVDSHWVLHDRAGHRYRFEQSSTGGKPFEGIVDIAFLIESGLDQSNGLLLESPERSICFSVQ